MKSYLDDYSVLAARDLNDALILLSKDTNLKPLAGGTDLMVLFESGKLKSTKLLSLHGLQELKNIVVESGYIEIGALVTFSQIASHPVIQKEFSLLGAAAQETGALAIQNRGTLGGNIMNASPAADSPPALLVYETQIQLKSSNSERWIDYSNFHLDYKKTQIAASELLTKIRIKRDKQNAIEYYQKVGTRKAQAISKVCFAVRVIKENNKILSFRLALGSVAPTPIRCFKIEALLAGQTLNSKIIEEACQVLQKEISPISDIRSTEKYRRKVSENILKDFLNKL